MNGSTVQSWINHPGVIDTRHSLEIPYRMEQFAALMWRLPEKDTTVNGDRLTMLDGGRYPFPAVMFIGPAGEARFHAGASWDELGGAQVEPAPPSVPGTDTIDDILQRNPSIPDESEVKNWREKFVPVLDMEDENPSFSPLLSMAYGGVGGEVREFVDTSGADDDEDNEDFLVEEYFLEEKVK
ncbi:uncharacterized protein LOC132747576 [Ruditapes philippinarum]|uniref:uncharacterized protein LOC132747576 n=1 Tax=Ruditapes philippinarum TaxID=129788 RepID=UPI00295B8731|nr:uncharacterized protein LOC132747576 [Ruditapes philippinarum]